MECVNNYRFFMEVIKWTSAFYNSLPDNVNKLVLYGSDNAWS